MAKKYSFDFFDSTKSAKTEEDVKHNYAEHFGIKYNTADKHDLYTPQVLFEFKLLKNFESVKIRAALLAQLLYYVRRLKFGTFVEKRIPFYLCLADQNEAILTETNIWKKFYDDADEKYDWDLAPSSPDMKLINDLAETNEVKNLHIYKVRNPTEFGVFAEQLSNCLNPQVSLFGDKKLVNDFVNQNNTALLSGPYVSAGALSVTPENFEKALVVHAVRRIPKADWLNDRDQFMQPNIELSATFVDDCAIWNLFSNSNATAAMRNVEYEKQIYQIRNHFFPFTVSEVKHWTITDGDIAETLINAEDTFVANWLLGRNLSNEAKDVLTKGKEIYKFYFANLGQVRTTKFKIETWDAGWWQIRNVLADVNLGKEMFDEIKILHNKLKVKILPKINEYGIMTV